MASFYKKLREKVGKDSDTAKHRQSTLMGKLQLDVMALISQLERNGIPYNMPDDVCNDCGERTNSRREAGHTKGNTKNQRKNMKRQQRKVLTAVINHLVGTLSQAGIVPCVYNDKDRRSCGHATSDSTDYDSEHSRNSDDLDGAMKSVLLHAIPPPTLSDSAVAAVQLSHETDEWDAQLDDMLVLFREEPLGFRVLERAQQHPGQRKCMCGGD